MSTAEEVCGKPEFGEGERGSGGGGDDKVENLRLATCKKKKKSLCPGLTNSNNIVAKTTCHLKGWIRCTCRNMSTAFGRLQWRRWASAPFLAHMHIQSQLSKPAAGIVTPVWQCLCDKDQDMYPDEQSVL